MRCAVFLEELLGIPLTFVIYMYSCLMSLLSTSVMRNFPLLMCSFPELSQFLLLLWWKEPPEDVSPGNLQSLYLVCTPLRSLLSLRLECFVYRPPRSSLAQGTWSGILIDTRTGSSSTSKQVGYHGLPNRSLQTLKICVFCPIIFLEHLAMLLLEGAQSTMTG